VIQISDQAERLDIISHMPWGKRMLFALLALFPMIAPYELLWKIQWTTYWHPFFLLAAFISAGAIALSCFFVFAALARLSSQISLDARRATFTYTEFAPVVPQRTHEYPLSAIESFQVRKYDWSDSSPSYSLEIKLSDGKTFASDSSWNREEIERAIVQVEAFLERQAHFRQLS